MRIAGLGTMKFFYPAVFLGLVQCCHCAGEIDPNNWVDWSLPRTVSVAPFEGDRYEAKVPDTVDLAEHAKYALNMGTRLWAPQWGYEQLFDVLADSNPPRLGMGFGGLTNCGPKMIEALPMLRVMTGSSERIEVDGEAIMGLVRITGKDGLCYQPVENRPWAFFDDYTKKERTPFSDVFGEGRQLLAYAAWYQHDHNPLWKDLALRKVNRLLELSLRKEDTLYFRMSRGFTPWGKDQSQGPIVAVADITVHDSSKGMVGTPASYISGFIPMAGSIWYRLTGEQAFLELSRGLARYLFLYGEMIDPNTGEFLADHETHVTHSLFANLSWALTFDDPAMVEWVRRGYEWYVHRLDPDHTGVIFGIEPCRIADTLGIGILLSRAGVGDYWENVDRWVRNTYIDSQTTSVDWIKRRPLDYRKDLEPGYFQFEDGADRCLGVWGDLSEEWVNTQGCCYSNSARMLYFVWSNIITSTSDELRVNLLLNRASPWADLDSWIPNEGRVRLTMKTARKSVLIRIPAWTDRNLVVCTLNGKTRKGIWDGNYLNVGEARPKDRIVVDFPVKQRTITSKVEFSYQKDGEDKVEMRECKMVFRGNTLIDITPDLGYPVFKHAKFRSEKCAMKKVTRFVSKEQFLF